LLEIPLRWIEDEDSPDEMLLALGRPLGLKEGTGIEDGGAGGGDQSNIEVLKQLS
jgi:hypothetical protein